MFFALKQGCVIFKTTYTGAWSSPGFSIQVLYLLQK